MNSLQNHVLFTMQFMQMMEDFQTVENECPACGHSSRSNTVCLRNECDFMLFIDMGKLHPSVIPWIEARKEALK